MYEIDPADFLPAPGLSWQACLKKTGVEEELLTDIDMLLMVKKGTIGGICQAIHRYAKASNKYMKNYNKNDESSYIEYLDANNLYGCAIPQKLPVNGFKWVEKSRLLRFNKIFIKIYNENSDIGYFLEVDINYPKELFNLHKNLPFLPGRKKVDKVEKLICGIEDKGKYVMHIKVLKQAIQFNQEDWLKPYIYMNTKLRKEAKNDFEKDFFKLMNNFVFGKTIENVRKHRDIKLVTTDAKRNKLVSEPNYHTTKRFSKNLLAIKMKKTKIKMKPIYLGMSILDISMSILDISKTLIYKFWYYYFKP